MHFYGWKQVQNIVLQMLRPEEVENLVCGSPELKMAELKKVTVYDGYKPTDHTIV